MPVGLWGFFGAVHRAPGAGALKNGKAIAKRRAANKRARAARKRG